ncbi:hypothetical protein DFJ74DRAFT_676425 [Hyaloraphidium curvatum]|nr:hypothetical protein DFJ74DRAFT_676425 [Hyaloraphidium curvatum]
MAAAVRAQYDPRFAKLRNGLGYEGRGWYSRGERSDMRREREDLVDAQAMDLARAESDALALWAAAVRDPANAANVCPCAECGEPKLTDPEAVWAGDAGQLAARLPPGSGVPAIRIRLPPPSMGEAGSFGQLDVPTVLWGDGDNVRLLGRDKAGDQDAEGVAEDPQEGAASWSDVPPEIAERVLLFCSMGTLRTLRNACLALRAAVDDVAFLRKWLLAPPDERRVALYDRTEAMLAKHHLTAKAVPVAEVLQQLGAADPGACHGCKRSPEELPPRADGGAAPPDFLAMGSSTFLCPPCRRRHFPTSSELPWGLAASDVSGLAGIRLPGSYVTYYPLTKLAPVARRKFPSLPPDANPSQLDAAWAERLARAARRRKEALSARLREDEKGEIEAALKDAKLLSYRGQFTTRYRANLKAGEGDEGTREAEAFAEAMAYVKGKKAAKAG